MAIIYTYSSVTPEPTDLLVITDVSDNNYTKSSTITAAIAATIAAGQNIWFTTSGAGVITINSADFTLDGRNNSFVPRKWGTVLIKDDNGAITETYSSIRAIQTGDNQGPDGIGAALGVSTGRAFDMSNFDADDTSVLEIYEYAGGSNVGYVPDGGTSTDLLNGAGGWTAISSLSFDIDGLNASATATTYTISPGDTITLKSTGTSTSEGAASNIAGVVARLDNVDPSPNTIFVGLRSNGGSPSNTTFYRGDGVWAPATSSGTSEVVQTVRNTSGVDIEKGVALHITGNTSGTPDVTYATSDGNYPASGLALSDIPNNSTGQMILLGVIDTLDTTAIAGTGGGLGETIYIKEAPSPIPATYTINDSLTFDPPTGGAYSTPENKLQNVGILVRDNATQGAIQVTAGGRVAATPNLTRGSLFVGNSSNKSVELQRGNTGEVLTVDASGDIDWAAAPAGYTNWTLDGDSGLAQTINSGNVASIQGGTDINTVASNTRILTVSHDAISRTNTTTTASPAFGGTFDVIDSATSSLQGHLTAVNVKTVTLPSPTYSTYTLSNQVASNPDINLTGTTNSSFQMVGGTGINVTGTAGVVTIDNTIVGPTLTNWDNQLTIGVWNNHNGTALNNTLILPNSLGAPGLIRNYARYYTDGIKLFMQFALEYEPQLWGAGVNTVLTNAASGAFILNLPYNPSRISPGTGFDKGNMLITRNDKTSDSGFSAPPNAWDRGQVWGIDASVFTNTFATAPGWSGLRLDNYVTPRYIDETGTTTNQLELAFTSGWQNGVGERVIIEGTIEYFVEGDAIEPPPPLEGPVQAT